MNFTLKIIIFLSLLTGALCSYAQQIVNPPALEKLLAGKTKYYDIVATVDSFYAKALRHLSPADANQQSTLKRQMKMWQRWKMQASIRLQADGTVANALTYVLPAWEQQASIHQHGPSGNWKTLGPTNYNTTGGHNGGLGRVNCVAFSPSNTNLVYAGTANGGLWRREGNGNWTALTDHLPSVSISGVVVNYQNANDIWILTGDGDSGGSQGMYSAGVFESHDAGSTWKASGQFPGLRDTLYNGYKLIQHPTDPAIFFACTSKGLYRSSNYCASWTRVNPSLWLWPGTSNLRLPSYTDIEFKPDNPNTIYVTSNEVSPTFQRSTDGGLTFTPISNTQLNAARRLAIGVSPHQPNRIYLLSGPATGPGMFNGFFSSADSGNTWATNATTPNILGYAIDGSDDKHQTNYDLCVAVNPANANMVATGGIDCYNSTNGGVTFTKRTHWNFKQLSTTVPNYIHADIHNLVYNGNRLYACTDGGLSYSDNNGNTWTDISRGLNILQPYKIAGIETDANHWISGTQDNGAMYRNNSGMVVQHIGGGDGRSGLIDPANVSNIAFSTNEKIFVSANAGTHITDLTPPDIVEGNGWPALSHNVDNFTEKIAGYQTGIYKYYPNAFIWSNRGAAGNSALINCPSNSSRFYAAQGNKLYRSDNAADSWTDISDRSGFPSGTFFITDLAVSPTNSGLLYMTVGGYVSGTKIYQSNNGGETWVNISGNLANVATISVAAGASGSVYVGNELGVFYRPGNGNDWLPFYNGLPKCPVYDLLINFTTGKIRAATFGRGIWESDLHSPCSNTLNITGEIRGSNFYEAGSMLTASQQAGGGTGTQLIYRSAGNIVLTTGMEVKDAATGTIFKAYLGPCGQMVQRLGEGYSQIADEITVEELNTGRYPPIKDLPYYRITGDALEFYVPDYQKAGIYLKGENATEIPLTEQEIYPKGLYRIRNAGTDGKIFIYRHGGKVVKID